MRIFRAKTTFYFCIPLISLLLFSSEQGLGKKKPNGPPPVYVETMKLEPVFWQPSIHAVGTLGADNGVTVTSETAGQITDVLFKAGQMVKKGDPLIQLNPDVLKAQKAAAEVDLNLKKVNFERFAKLSKRGAVAQTEYDKSFADYKAAEANLDKIKAELAQRLIKAPFDGEVGLALEGVGSYVTPGTPLVSLQDTQPMVLDFFVPEVYLGKVGIGNDVSLRVSSYRREDFKGKISSLNNRVDPETRMLKMKAEIPNEDKRLVPGMFANVTLFLGEKKPVLMIPRTAILVSEKGEMVYIVENKKAKKVIITTGEGDANHIMVRSGLKKGDELVTAGQMKLKNGAPVMIVKPNKK